ncbi:MAG: hypothetical protein IKT95_06385 [Spirochaetales bacterium]|nr:hypothetical protein [Spirochaetales bacterium]
MRNRRLLFTAALMLAVLLASCSVVFEAGISGTVETPSGTGKTAVAGVNVFAYTDKNSRDSDYDLFCAGTITRPREDSGYVATTSTNANGEFTVNKIVWETKRSDFGKTADVNRLYLIFYHEDYYPEKADATVISGSTNSGNVSVTLNGNKDYTTINLTVYNATTNKAMTAPVTLEYWQDDSPEHDTVTVTGNISIPISFRKGTQPDVSFILSSPGDSWMMCRKDGTPEDKYVENDVEEGTFRVSLYMKSNEFTLPAFSGDIDGSYSAMPNLDDVDNVTVRLAYVDTQSAVHFFAETESAQPKTYCTRYEVGDNAYFEHGRFSGVGYNDNYSIVINKENYPDIVDWDAWETGTFTELSVTLRLYFDFASQKYYEFTYSPLKDAALGHIKDQLVVAP